MEKNANSQAAIAEATVSELDAFGKALQEIDDAVNPRMNIFRAMGLVNHEAHHSSFFAGLLDPDNPHHLGDYFLREFFRRLFEYRSKADDLTRNPVQNAAILAAEGIHSMQELSDLIRGHVFVEKEVSTITKTDDKSGRMDIMIEIPTSETVIVIENKTGTTTHDNQLRKYQNDIKVRFNAEYKKIFVYLSPRGELPYDRKGHNQAEYNPNYCVFDYVQICEIVKDAIAELEDRQSGAFQLNKTDKSTLLYGLKEYLDMCNTDLLNENVGKFEKCAEIVAAHPASIKKLLDYFNSPLLENVICYCAQKINGDPSVDGPRVFATRAMRDFFEKNGEPYSAAKLRCYVNPRDNKPFNGYQIYVELENVNNDDPYDHIWTPVQKMLIEELLRLGKLKKAPNNSSRLISKHSLLDASDCYKTMEEVAPKLEANLDKFMIQLNELDNILKSLTPSAPKQP